MEIVLSHNQVHVNVPLLLAMTTDTDLKSPAEYLLVSFMYLKTNNSFFQLCHPLFGPRNRVE